MAIKKSSELEKIEGRHWDDLVDALQNKTSGHKHDGTDSFLISAVASSAPSLTRTLLLMGA